MEVRNTSPLSSSGGISFLHIDDDSDLLYLGGQTSVVKVSENATAALKGGRIDYIRSLQYTTTKHIDLYCQPGWEWLYEDEDLDGIDEVVGITGLWDDTANTPFTIGFTNDYTFGYDPVYMNINVITPEPATLVLLCIGALMLKKRKR